MQREEFKKEVKKWIKEDEGVDNFIDTVIELNLTTIAQNDSAEVTFIMLNALGVIKEVFKEYDPSYDSKIKWNAHYEIVKKEHKERVLKKLEENLKKTEKIRYDSI